MIELILKSSNKGLRILGTISLAIFVSTSCMISYLLNPVNGLITANGDVQNQITNTDQKNGSKLAIGIDQLNDCYNETDCDNNTDTGINVDQLQRQDS